MSNIVTVFRRILGKYLKKGEGPREWITEFPRPPKVRLLYHTTPVNGIAYCPGLSERISKAFL